MMNLKLLKNATFFSNNFLIEDQEILIDESKILEIKTEIAINENIKTVDLAKNLLTPGFIDLQVNGGEKIFFNNDISPTALRAIYKAHLNSGTRYILPTLITSSLDKILLAIDVVGKEMKRCTGILGLHLEGPFLNKEKKGGHNQNIIRNPTDRELDIIIEKGEGVVKKITIAPEMFTDQQLKRLNDSNIVVSVGHSNATYEQAIDFFSKGVNCVTHLYNAMSTFSSREPGLAGATLNSEVFAGIIVDGVHSHYAAVNMAFKLKKEKLFLVSDASFTNVKEGERFSFEGIEIQVKNGNIFTSTGSLAGSSITMRDAIKNSVDHAQIPKAHAICMATETPAKVLGLESEIGRIEVNNSSKINVLDKDLNLIKMFNSD